MIVGHGEGEEGKGGVGKMGSIEEGKEGEGKRYFRRSYVGGIEERR